MPKGDDSHAYILLMLLSCVNERSDFVYTVPPPTVLAAAQSLLP